MSNNNNIESLRKIMFETLRGVKDGTIEPEKAKSINDTAQTIINTAKVEIDFIRVTGQASAASSFLSGQGGNKQITNTPTGTKVVDEDPATGITSTVHRMR